MSKNHSVLAVCGTYGNPPTKVKNRPSRKERPLMRKNSTRRANNIIPFPQRQNHPCTQPHTHKKPWGKYAKLHQAFLQTHHPKFYTQLSALGKLDEWLHTIDEITTHRFELGKNLGYTQSEIENTLFKEVIYNLR